jgi:hypothetical protein
MWEMCGRRAVVGCSLLLLWAGACQAISVATVGDSFADSLYNAMRALPDLMRRYGLQLTRWSRPNIGLTRTDYFDYTKWLRESSELGSVDVCFAQIGSNDMQSIPVAKNQWIAYGSGQWRAAYAARTHKMAQVLTEQRCGLLIWVLQPGFEMQDALACHRELINEVQRETLRLDRTRVLEIATSEAAYGRDKTHFNREYVLQLGIALFRLVDTSHQIIDRGCMACHRQVEGLGWEPAIAPLLARRPELAMPVWVPDRVGVQCRIAVQRRVTFKKLRKVAHSRRAH